MAPMNQMKPSDMVAYMGFGEADHVHLRALWLLVELELDNICAVFFTRALSNPVTRAVLGDPGRVSRLVQVEDQTDAILSEARLRKQENLAQLGTLAATVAHELRNPLAGISGALQLLSQGFEPGDRRAEVMLKVMTQVHGLDALVSDLLAFVRPKEPRRETVALHEVVASVVENAAIRFGGIRISSLGDGEGLATRRWCVRFC